MDFRIYAACSILRVPLKDGSFTYGELLSDEIVYLWGTNTEFADSVFSYAGKLSEISNMRVRCLKQAIQEVSKDAIDYWWPSHSAIEPAKQVFSYKALFYVLKTMFLLWFSECLLESLYWFWTKRLETIISFEGSFPGKNKPCRSGLLRGGRAKLFSTRYLKQCGRQSSTSVISSKCDYNRRHPRPQLAWGWW